MISGQPPSTTGGHICGSIFGVRGQGNIARELHVCANLWRCILPEFQVMPRRFGHPEVSLPDFPDFSSLLGGNVGFQGPLGVNLRDVLSGRKTERPCPAGVFTRQILVTHDCHAKPANCTSVDLLSGDDRNGSGRPNLGRSHVGTSSWSA